MNFLNELKVHFLYDFKQSFKDWKIIISLVLLLLILFGSVFFLNFTEQKLNEYSKKNNYEQHRDVDLFNIIDSEFGNLGLILPLILCFVFLPVIILIMFFDVISSEKNSNSIKYIIPRSRIESFYLGKFLSALSIIISSLLFFLVISNIYIIMFLQKTVFMKDIFLTLLILTIYSSTLIAIIMFFSTFFRKSIHSLGLGLGGLIFLLILLKLGVLKHLSLFNYTVSSINSGFQTILFNMIILLIYTIIFLILGMVKLGSDDI